MELVTETVNDYIDAVDSPSSAPGGGSVAALVGALGVSLAKMLGHFSVDKKKFKEASQKEQEQFILSVKELDNYKDILVSNIDNDAISYDAVVEAYKSKDEETIQQALKASAYVAFEITESSYKALTFVPKLIKLGNKNLYSDLVTAAILLDSCCEASSLNVIANAKLITDEEIKNDYLAKQEDLVKKARALRNKVARELKA